MKRLYAPGELLDAEQKDAELAAKTATDALLPNLSGDAP